MVNVVVGMEMIEVDDMVKRLVADTETVADFDMVNSDSDSLKSYNLSLEIEVACIGHNMKAFCFYC